MRGEKPRVAIPVMRKEKPQVEIDLYGKKMITGDEKAHSRCLHMQLTKCERFLKLRTALRMLGTN